VTPATSPILLPTRACRPLTCLALSLLILWSVAGCEQKRPQIGAQGPIEVTALTVVEKDAPVNFEFVGNTESSRQVEIRARVNGFLDKRVYVEGAFLKADTLMFLMDAKPFAAQLAAARAELAEQRARLETARANLKRVKPLAAENAVSQKDLDDAIGQEKAAAAAVEAAKANVEQASLNLSYTKIHTPVTGLSSFARVQDGAYVNQANSLLTYVAQLDPIWVNFSLSENQRLQHETLIKEGKLRPPPDGNYQVDVVLANGIVYPHVGRITFADASYSRETGTFLLRATLANPHGTLRPGQFVRVVIKGAIRPNAILVPQSAVLQGAQGHFVWVVDEENKAQIRNVQVGPWYGDQWFINNGLSAGDVVVVNGSVRLANGAPVKIVQQAAMQAQPSASGPATSPPAAPAVKTGTDNKR
jgi:membrane fusion protein (multidrug efflux system)